MSHLKRKWEGGKDEQKKKKEDGKRHIAGKKTSHNEIETRKVCFISWKSISILSLFFLFAKEKKTKYKRIKHGINFFDKIGLPWSYYAQLILFSQSWIALAWQHGNLKRVHFLFSQKKIAFIQIHLIKKAKKVPDAHKKN